MAIKKPTTDTRKIDKMRFLYEIWLKARKYNLDSVESLYYTENPSIIPEHHGLIDQKIKKLFGDWRAK